jgi:hypothetical protein
VHELNVLGGFHKAKIVEIDIVINYFLQNMLRVWALNSNQTSQLLRLTLNLEILELSVQVNSAVIDSLLFVACVEDNIVMVFINFGYNAVIFDTAHLIHKKR